MLNHRSSSFKPSFPLDPFAASHSVPSTRPPWSVHAESLPVLPLLQSERRVILAIGQSASATLEPLFHSPQLTSSLLIIASHRPPVIPPTALPAVHTLRLRSPIAVENAGATRLVDILEWAVQVAQLWRRTNGPHVQELLEEVSGTSDSVKLAQSSGRLRYSVVPSTASGTPLPPLTSQDNVLSSATSLSTSASSSKRRQSINPLGGTKTFRRKSGIMQPPLDPEQRPFDAIFNFLPADIPDKALLKAAILVTTLTRPYLAAAPSRAPATRFWMESSKMPVSPPSMPSRRRWSFLRSTGSAMSSSSTVNVETRLDGHKSGSLAWRSTSNLSESSGRTMVSTLARCRKSRLVHLMPSVPAKASQFHSSLASAQARLVRSIEAFLLSFSFPVPTAAFSPSDPDFTRARPYLLPSSALSDVLQFGHESPKCSEEKSEWTLAELILSGALVDAPPADGGRTAGDDIPGKKEAPAGVPSSWAWMEHRVWISGMADVVVHSKVPQAHVQVPAQAHVIRNDTTKPKYPSKPAHARKPVPQLEKRLPTPPEDETAGPSQARTHLSPDHVPSRYSHSQPQPRLQSQPQSRPHPLSDSRRHTLPVERRASGSRTTHSRARASASAPSPHTHKLTRLHSQPEDVHGLPTPPDSEKASLDGLYAAGGDQDYERRRARVGSDPNPARDPLRRAKTVQEPRPEPESRFSSAPAAVTAEVPRKQDKRQELRREKRHLSSAHADGSREERMQRKARALMQLSAGTSSSPTIPAVRPEHGLLKKRSSWNFWKNL